LPIPLIDLADLDPTERDRLAAIVANQATLGDVLEWGLAQRPVRQPEEIVTQEGEKVLGYAACVFKRPDLPGKRTSGPGAGAP
jgi:hypothetical protein